jgi:histidinol dehydrogenase
MSVIPAVIAGVKEIIICTPSSNSKINPAIIYASQICGVKKIFKIGGAQAITAMAIGTQIIPKVDKIVGPGNAYVSLAKKQLYGEVGIDMIAGPTDVTIIAQSDANVKFIAIDALSQLEHGIDSKAFIIVDNFDFAQKILSEIDNLKNQLSRKEIIEKSLKNSAIFVINNLDDAHFLANFIAPEHLQILTTNPKELINKISNAGAIFVGQYTPEAIGDYIAGPSHTLPTSSTSRFASGLSVYDFLKRQSLMQSNQNSFSKLSKHASLLAKVEGLTAHQLSIDIRNI